MARSKRLGLKLLASRIPHEGDLANLMPGDYASFRARFPMIYEGRCFFKYFSLQWQDGDG